MNPNVVGAKIEIFFGQQASAIDESHQTKIYPLLAREARGRRAAFNVHLTRSNHLKAILGRDRHPTELEIDAELLLNFAGNMCAEVNRITYRSSVWTGERERRRRREMSKGECARLLNLLERAVQLLGHRIAGQDDRRQQYANRNLCLRHRSLLKAISYGDANTSGLIPDIRNPTAETRLLLTTDH